MNQDSGLSLNSDEPIPELGEEDALVRVLLAGICGTDIEITKGYKGYSGILGHEFVGRVEKLGPNVPKDSSIQVGKRVVGDINLICGKCTLCTSGKKCEAGSVMYCQMRNHCPNRTVLGIVQKDGAFAEYLTLPLANLHVVPDGVSDVQAAFTEPLAAACRILEQNLIGQEDRVALIGDGRLGLLISDVLSTHGCKKILHIGKHSEKLALVNSNIETALFDENTKERYSDAFDVCIEATGSPGGIMLAAAITRPMGTVVLKSTCASTDSSFDSVPLVVKELTIVGSRCGPFEKALELLASGRVKPERLLSKSYPIDEALEAIKHAGTKGTLKIQLLFP